VVTPRPRVIALLSSLTALFLLVAACGGASSSPSPTATVAATATPAGPTATIDPRSGPPGIQVTVTGSGWPAGARIDLIGAVDPGQQGTPYDTVIADRAGKFEAHFRVDKTATGADLKTGRYDVFARSGDTSVDMVYLVDVRRPVSEQESGG
jgi:hypothetical protein